MDQYVVPKCSTHSSIDLKKKLKQRFKVTWYEHEKLSILQLQIHYSKKQKQKTKMKK